jgi:hypothetical protein
MAAIGEVVEAFCGLLTSPALHLEDLAESFDSCFVYGVG